MTSRRTVNRVLLSLATASADSVGAAAKSSLPTHKPATADYRQFLAGVRLDAAQQGIPGAILDAALALDVPNARVLQLDRHQPEFTLTWAQYRTRVISPAREENANRAYRENLSLLTSVWRRYQVDPRVIVGIWGLESNFGGRSGSFNVVDALATLAFDGRRASFFRSELMSALHILGHGDVVPAGMLGSYAGAMGQPQFMPSSYLRYAVDYSGDGHRNIWTDRADVFASIGNYLARNGWIGGEPWGQPVRLTQPVDPAATGRGAVRSLSHWDDAGVRRTDGTRLSRADVGGSLLLPDGQSGDAFLVYKNFDVIRRYNPSDFYALAVGLIGNAAA